MPGFYIEPDNISQIDILVVIMFLAIISALSFIVIVIIVAIIQRYKNNKLLLKISVNDEIKISQEKEVITVRCLSNFTNKKTIYVQTLNGKGYVLHYSDDELSNFELLNPNYKLK